MDLEMYIAEGFNQDAMSNQSKVLWLMSCLYRDDNAKARETGEVQNMCNFVFGGGVNAYAILMMFSKRRDALIRNLEPNFFILDRRQIDYVEKVLGYYKDIPSDRIEELREHIIPQRFHYQNFDTLMQTLNQPLHYRVIQRAYSEVFDDVYLGVNTRLNNERQYTPVDEFFSGVFRLVV